MVGRLVSSAGAMLVLGRVTHAVDAATRITAKEKPLAQRKARRTTPCKDSMRESQEKVAF